MMHATKFSRLVFVMCLCAFGAAGGKAEVRVEVKDAVGASVADAVASLSRKDAAVVPEAPADPVVIEQRNSEFSVYVTPIVVGTRVLFPNRDKIQHHVFSLSKAKRFEIPLYRGEASEPVLFDRPGVVTLGCNIHDWMSAYIVVLATPYFRKTADDGFATFEKLPAGDYQLEVWHPRLAEPITRDVVVQAADAPTQVIEVTLKPDRRIRRAPESQGSSGYK